MTPERFRRVDQPVSLALERAANERAEFILEGCAGEEDLRLEVESLLASHDNKDGFLAEAPARLAAQLLAESAGHLDSPSRFRLPIHKKWRTASPNGELAPGRYKLVEKLGVGGMGVVYLAEDPQLGRKVAIKLMEPKTSGAQSASEGRARLLREAQALAQLSHPNVIAVYDVGTCADQVFIAMEYVEGSTLSQWLAEQKRTWREVLSTFVQAGRGLAAAHAAGIVHRDFKPDNVLVGNDGRVRVLDFGLARPQPGKSEQLTTAEGQAPAERTPHRLAMLGVTVTQQGKFIGTPVYMAPEQLMRERVNEKTDQYSFCVALFQGLYGTFPFNADNFDTLLEQIMQRKVNEVPNLNSVPSSVHQALLRGLSPNPADRFSSMEALLDKLGQQQAVPRRQTLVVAGLGIAVALLLATGGWWGLRARNSTQGVVEDRSIAVLPFANLSSDKDQEYFSDGIADEIRNALAQIEGLRVAGRTSSLYFKGNNEDLAAIADKLHVATVLEGSVRKAGNQVRITAQLINAKDGYELWSKQYDRDLIDILKVQGELATAVVESLKVKLAPGSAVSTKIRVARDPEAYRLYLLGRSLFFIVTKESTQRAVALLEKAVTLEPSYAPAWEMLAYAQGNLVSYSGYTWDQKQTAIRQALASAERAIAVDPEYFGGWNARGRVRGSFLWEWAAAQSDHERALALSSSTGEALNGYANFLVRQGRVKEAIVFARKFADYDPLNAHAWRNLAWDLAGDGRFDAAREAQRRALEISPDDPSVLKQSVPLDLVEGRTAQALEALEKMPPDNFKLMYVALAQHVLGRAQQSRQALEALAAKPEGDVAYMVAAVHTWRGEHDAAFDWLERAYSLHDWRLGSVKMDPLLRALRGDPRYMAVLKKMNLPLD